jgi:hypothetical protein
METRIEPKEKQISSQIKTGDNKDEYRQSIKLLIDTAVKNALDEEMHKAIQELLEEQRKAVRQVLEELRATLRQIVEEEKKAVWERAEELRKSILKLGL